MKMAWMFASSNSGYYPSYLQSSGLHKFCWILIIVCTYFGNANPTVVCSTNSDLSLGQSLRQSEEVIRGKVQRIEDSQTLVVKVINVYKGDNSTEGKNIIIKIIPDYRLMDDPSICMSDAIERLKYIFLLRKQSPFSDRVFYLQHDGILATRDVSRTIRQIVQEQSSYERIDWVTTVTMATFSDADHYAECSAPNYCFNGGTCTYIVSLQKNTCECPANYKGPRCEYYNFLAVGNTEDNSNVTYIVLGCTFALIFVLCVAVAALYIRFRRKNLRITTQQNEKGEEAALTGVTVQGDKNQNTESKPGHSIQVSKIPDDSGHISQEEEESKLIGQTLYSSMDSMLTSSGSIYRKESAV